MPEECFRWGRGGGQRPSPHRAERARGAGQHVLVVGAGRAREGAGRGLGRGGRLFAPRCGAEPQESPGRPWRGEEVPDGPPEGRGGRARGPARARGRGAAPLSAAVGVGRGGSARSLVFVPRRQRARSRPRAVWAGGPSGVERRREPRVLPPALSQVPGSSSHPLQGRAGPRSCRPFAPGRSVRGRRGRWALRKLGQLFFTSLF